MFMAKMNTDENYVCLFSNLSSVCLIKYVLYCYNNALLQILVLLIFKNVTIIFIFSYKAIVILLITILCVEEI